MERFEQDVAEMAGLGTAPIEFVAREAGSHPETIDTPALPPRVMAALMAHRLEFEIDVCDLFDAQLRGKAPPLIDARIGRAFRTAHIAGAVHMDADSISNDTLRMLPAAPYIAVYGSDAQRLDAVRVSHEIAKLGFAVKIVNGGFAAWTEQGFPVAQSSAPTHRIAAL
jgi:rhodanese-related sulfurtransferase